MDVTSEEMKTEIFNYNWDFSKPAKALITLELLISFQVAFCNFLVSDEILMEKLGLSISSTLYFLQLVNFLGLMIGIPLGWLSDSWIGKRRIVFTGALFATVAPVFSIILQFKSLHSKLRLFSFYACLYAIASCLATTGVRTSLYFEQEEETLAMNKYRLRNYVFLMWFIRIAKDLLTSVFFFLYTWYRSCMFWHNVLLCICSPALFVPFYQPGIKLGSVHSGIIEQCIKCIFKTVSWKKLFNIKCKWVQSDKICDPEIACCAKRMLSLTILLIALCAYGFSTYSLQEILRYHITKNDPIKSHRLLMISTTMLTFCHLVMLIMINFLIIPYTETLNFVTDLRSFGWGYFIIGLSLIGTCVVIFFDDRGFIPIKYYGQVRIYNGLSDSVVMESYWTGSQSISPGDVEVIQDIPCIDSCVTNVEIFYNWKASVTDVIEAKELQSITYVIMDKGLRAIAKPDPVLPEVILKEGENTSYIFCICSHENLRGTLSMSDKLIPIEFSSKQTFYNFSIPTQEIVFGFQLYSSSSKDYSSPIPLIEGGLYSLFILYDNNTHVSFHIHTISVYPNLCRTRLEYLVILLPCLLYCFGLALCQLTITRFIWKETPVQISAFTNSILYFFLECGYLVSIMKGSLLSTSPKFILLITSFHFACLSLYIWYAINYKPKRFDKQNLRRLQINEVE